MQTCPYCQSEIQDNVIKCKHCGEFVSDKYRKTKEIVKRGLFQWSARIFCPECHYEGKTTKYKREWSGSAWCLLYLFFVIPWLIYDAYRGGNFFVCPKCGNKHIKAIK